MVDKDSQEKKDGPVRKSMDNCVAMCCVQGVIIRLVWPKRGVKMGEQAGTEVMSLYP